MRTARTCFRQRSARRLRSITVKSRLHQHDPQVLRRAFSSFATGVTVITTLDERGAPVGLTINSFGSVSLDPPLVQWSLRVNSGLHRIFVEAQRFGVSVLAEDQEALARRFSARMANPFADVAWHARAGDPPLLDGAIAHFLCTKTQDYRVGDHELFVGRVDEVHIHPGQPLLFFHSRFETLPSAR